MSDLSVEQAAALACLLEATAPKVGNVHRGADFEDVTFTHFAISAVVAAPSIAQAAEIGVGQAIYRAVSATRTMVASNTNLGIALLLAPLAKAAGDVDLQGGVGQVLASLTPDDAHWTWQAIRLAVPGGLGKVDEMDVNDDPPEDLLTAMSLAADRDLVARQYANSFHEVFQEAAVWIEDAAAQGWPLTTCIVHAHLRLLGAHADTLILRKCGADIANKASALARQVLACGDPDSPAYLQAIGDLDFWLRSDHHRRNPGATADLVTAGLFVLLLQGRLKPPLV
ncbi:triphosphoribosyl-dephospho-CoA synthase [Lignipirellula cremea]|uniref:ATP:dephospho-CoA triphosphoribosyl transferase n=1 Tax=Lignipirellula cremea TaxID=2528010 RepID=A0A518DZN9_9BACT|nr:triphosphoribosyl-dephospho-CoA synthase [Lignipirellula cremea]QDU97302.1 ATP:dephospho-CoA triphosphoribosyl transferase [Lignipirellula cremea]